MLLASVLVSSGCSAAAQEYIPVVAETMRTFVKMAKKRGVDFKTSHAVCSMEMTPDEGKLLAMCEVDIPRVRQCEGDAAR